MKRYVFEDDYEEGRIMILRKSL